nr:MAG TPA: baseplate protein [Caudoviricetes sp.]
MNAAQNPLNACPYWVGDILVTMSEIQPAQRWPGTSWEQITDCMLRAADDTHPAGSTGGAWEVVQTLEQMPRHNHAFATYQDGYSTGTHGADTYITPVGRKPYSADWYGGTESAYNGGSQPMPIENKYTAVYMYRRTG